MGEKQTSRGRLTGEQKRFVVQLLAEFQTPAQIVAAFADQFGRRITIPGVCHYRDSPRWAVEIERAREALLAAVRTLPVASKYWRLQQLHRLITEAEEARRIRSVRVGTRVLEPPVEVLAALRAGVAQVAAAGHAAPAGLLEQLERTLAAVSQTRTVAEYERVTEKDFRTIAVLLRQAGEELGQLGQAIDDRAPDRPRVATLAGRAVSPAVAGLPDPGPTEHGPG